MESKKTIREQQQTFYNLFGFKDQILWDIFEPNEKEYLKSKIQMATGEIASDRENGLTDVIWNQSKYTNGTLFLSIIYVLCTEKETDNDTSYSVHIVYRVKKCCNEANSRNCCMIFIDETGRVYKTWEKFKIENILPNNYAIAPKNGIYNGDDDDNVILEIFPTPSSSISETVLRATDTGTTGLAVLGTGVAIAAAIPAITVAPILLAGSAVAGIGCGLYGLARSAARLVDKSNHEEDISLANADSRACWLSVAGGTVGIGAGAATRCVSSIAAGGGNVSNIFQVGVNSLNLASLTINGYGVANSFVTLYYKDGEMTIMDWVHLSSSLFLFSHSIYNFQLASTIVDNSRNVTLQQYRNGLSKNQRRMFDKMAKETIRISGTDTGKQDIIRGLKSIPDTKTHFRDVYKINKDLNKNNIKISFGSDGKTLLNNQVEFDAAQLRASLNQQTSLTRQQIFLNNPSGSSIGGGGGTDTNSIVFSNVPKFDGKNYIPAKIDYNSFDVNGFNPVTVQLINKFIVGLSTIYFIRNEDNLKDCLKFLMIFVKEQINEIIDLTKEFIHGYGEFLEKKLDRKIPFEEYLVKNFHIICKLANQKLDEIKIVIDTKIDQLFDDLCQYFDLEIKNDLTDDNHKVSTIDYDTDNEPLDEIKINFIRAIFKNETSVCSNGILNFEQLILYTACLSDILPANIICKIIKMTVKFNKKYSNYIEKKLQRFISFDDNYIDLIHLLLNFADQSFDQFESVLDGMTEQCILINLVDFYELKNTYSKPNQICDQCNGTKI